MQIFRAQIPIFHAYAKKGGGSTFVFHVSRYIWRRVILYFILKRDFIPRGRNSGVPPIPLPPVLIGLAGRGDGLRSSADRKPFATAKIMALIVSNARKK